MDPQEACQVLVYTNYAFKHSNVHRQVHPLRGNISTDGDRSATGSHSGSEVARLTVSGLQLTVRSVDSTYASARDMVEGGQDLTKLVPAGTRAS